MTQPTEQEILLGILQAQQDRLIDAKEALENAKEELQRLKTFLAPSLDPLVEHVKLMTSAMNDIEAVMYQGLSRYHTVSGERVVPNIGEVKEQTDVVYEVAAATEWALEHSVCLRLDEEAFKKYCLVTKQLPPGVSIQKSWKPYLNRKALSDKK